MDQYLAIRGDQSGIGKDWGEAACFITILFIFIMIYTIVQYSQRPHFHWKEFPPTRVFGKMTAWTATWGLAFSLLPGVLARLIKQIRGPQAELSALLLWGLNIRKEVGLLALYFLYLHACIMLLIFGPLDYWWLYNDDGRLRRSNDWSMFMAVVSTSFFSIVGIISLPSVSTAMNKAQFGCVFGPVVYGGLATGLAHIMFLGVESWSDQDDEYSWAGNMPPITLMASLLPLLVLSLKLIQVTIALFQVQWWFVVLRQEGSSKTLSKPLGDLCEPRSRLSFLSSIAVRLGASSRGE